MKEDVLILAIESSCDETAAAVVKNGREVLSNVTLFLNKHSFSVQKHQYPPFHAESEQAPQK